MSDIVERVARAIWDTASAGYSGPFESASESQRDTCLRAAHAAIAALREPDEAMLDAGAGAHRDGAAATWRAMLDAAMDAPPAGKEDPK